MAITRTELTRSTEHNGARLSFCVDVALIIAKRNHNGHGKRTGDRRIKYIFGARKPHHGNDNKDFYSTLNLAWLIWWLSLLKLEADLNMGAPAFCCHSSPCCVVHLSTESFGFKIHGLANVGYPQLWKYFNIISIWLTKRAYFCGTLQWYYQDQQKKRRPQRINLQSPYLNDGTLHVYPLRSF